jgi:hypothetical protein
MIDETNEGKVNPLPEVPKTYRARGIREGRVIDNDYNKPSLAIDRSPSAKVIRVERQGKLSK